jgi:hypothetical protein
MFRLVLTIQACSRSNDFLESKWIIRYLAHCFSHCKCSSVCRMAWKRWLSRRMSVYKVRSLLVSRIAVAMFSRRCKTFIQYSKLMGRVRNQRSNGKRKRMKHEACLLTVFYWMNLLFRNWVVRSSTFCMKVSRKLFLYEKERVGQSNSLRMSSIVSRSNITSVSDTPFSGKVGSAG